MMTLRTAHAFLLVMVAFASVARATVHDQLFGNSFDIPADAPASTNEAARFLTQATFGPLQSDINFLTAVGYSEWIEEQLAKPATLSEPTVETVVTARTNNGQIVNQTQRLNRWYWQAAYAPDQLRPPRGTGYPQSRRAIQRPCGRQHRCTQLI